LTIKLIALDLDGTLLTEDLRMSARVRDALGEAMARGVRVTLASGRGYPAMAGWADELGITTPLISYQGAMITKVGTQESIYQRAFPVELVPALRDFGRAHDLPLTLYMDNSIYVERKRRSDAFYDKWFGLPFQAVDDLAAAVTGAPTKFIIIGDGEDLDAITPEVERQFGDKLQIMRSHRFFLEGLALATNKGTALAWLADRYDIRRAETMAIGDSGNDRAMVAWAGIGVAMGNATDEVKQVADWVTGTVEQDGVAEAIERFCPR
jgi:Cof subfamily protein (haloacid dehalogenase superfamily)